jgi:REP element-mobilizing transposase RayT
MVYSYNRDMARPLRIQYPGAFYHITCRGNGRKEIFLDDKDRAHFLALLSESLETYQVILYAYILMNNHFHLLVQTRRANLSEFMRCFNICYTGWFNYRHQRCGHLYQGRYKALLIDADDYLLVVSRYLHLNSVRVKGLRSANYQERWQYARRYRWSSFPGYIDTKKVLDIIDYDVILGMVGGRREYGVFVLDGVKNDLKNPFADVKHQMILGDDDFVARIKGEYIEGGSLREQPSYRNLVVEIVDPEVVLDCVVEVCGVDTVIMSQPRVRGGGVVRGIAAELLYKYSGLTEVEIGRLLGGIDYGGVHQLRRRLRKQIDYDNNIKGKYVKVENALKKLCSK